MKRLNDVLHVAKAIAALVGGIVTSLLTVYGPETPVGHVLTVVSAIATAVAVYVVPNRAD